MTVYDELKAERDAQDKKWGNAMDDRWSLGEWAALIAGYACRPIRGDLHTIDRATMRADLVKTAATAIAAIEALDRKVP
jgi:hypothetical protein